MKRNIRPLVIGNWKMNPGSQNAAKKLFSEVKKGVSRLDGIQVVIAPPSIFIPLARDIQNGSKRVLLSAQNVHWEEGGAHTGEISFPMYKSFGTKYAIIGHSERRAGGVTDEEVNRKVHGTLKGGLSVVMCVGEKKRDTHGNYLSYIENQIQKGLHGVSKAKLSSVIIAYEPIWAIGTGNTATPDDAHEMKIYIQKVLSDLYGRNFAGKVRILYGGSVHAHNADALLRNGLVDGFLIGGASLRSREFIEIAKIAKQYVNEKIT